MKPLQVDDLAELAEKTVEGEFTTEQAVNEIRRLIILSALKKESGNQRATARRLGIHRNTLANQMAELGIRPSGPTAKNGRREQ